MKMTYILVIEIVAIKPRLICVLNQLHSTALKTHHHTSINAHDIGHVRRLRRRLCKELTHKYKSLTLLEKTIDHCQQVEHRHKLPT